MSALLRLIETRVSPEWIDEYDHMNVAHYVTVCDLATYAFWNHLHGSDDLDFREGREYAVVETHVCYLAELRRDEAVAVTTQLLAHDDKRFVIFHRLLRSADETVAATVEVKAIGFNLRSRAVEPFAPAPMARLGEIEAAQGALERPAAAGRGVALSRR